MRFLNLLKFCMTSALVATSSALAINRTNTNVEKRECTRPLVFAHFIVGIVGSRTSPADYDGDMKSAKDAGIDAFALNIGTDSYTNTQLSYAYESAAKNGMKVFISFDFNWHAVTDAVSIGNLIKTYAAKPGQLMVDGKPFASSFIGDGLNVEALRAAAGNVYWAPNCQANTDLSHMDSAFNWAAWDSNGHNQAPTANRLVSVEDGDKAYITALEGKPYIAPISPWFSTHYGTEVSYSKNFVFPSDFLWFDRWTQILQSRPRFTEIITWNDYGESHYVGRLDSPHSDDGASKWVNGMPHTGWLDMAKPFIAAYHAGASDPTPYITEDKVVYWFRPTMSSLNCDATDNTMGDANNSSGLYFKGRPNGWQTLQDKVFIVTLLTKPGTLSVTVGGVTQTFQAPAGASKFSVNMAPGQVTFSVNGISGKAGMDILNYCPCGIYNFNAYVGTIPAGAPDQLQPAGYAAMYNGLKADCPIR